MSWPPKLIAATLVNAYVYASLTMARYRIGPEVALCAASVKIHTYAPFDLNMASAVAVKYLIRSKSFAMTYREREKMVLVS